MRGRMDERYFDEKKGLAADAIRSAIRKASEAASAIDASRYALPDLAAPSQVHELLRDAQLALNAARRDFEKSRWAAANTDLEFDDWLRKLGHLDLVL